MDELRPINEIHGTLVECFEEEQVQKVFDYIGEDKPAKGYMNEKGPVYIGTNTKKGLYTLHTKVHSLAGETITFEEFINSGEFDSNELYKTLGMGIIKEKD